MNRYVLSGVLADLVAGRHVLVVSLTQTESRAALEQLADAAIDRDLIVRRANGREYVGLPQTGGSVLFRSVGQSVRGIEADVVFIGADVTPAQMDELRLVAAAGGEVIR